VFEDLLDFAAVLSTHYRKVAIARKGWLLLVMLMGLTSRPSTVLGRSSSSMAAPHLLPIHLTNPVAVPSLEVDRSI
jgi:hypothetical protein